jgi:hypothetical protein
VTILEQASFSHLIQQLATLSDREKQLARQPYRPEPVRFSDFVSVLHLQRHIYGSSSVEVFADNTSLAISAEFVEHWLGLLGSTPRVAAFLSKTSPVVTALQKVHNFFPRGFLSISDAFLGGDTFS